METAAGGLARDGATGRPAYFEPDAEAPADMAAVGTGGHQRVDEV